ncbi:MAG: transglycosylase domain-containing protein [Verrucomicrobiales bacterium]
MGRSSVQKEGASPGWLARQPRWRRWLIKGGLGLAVLGVGTAGAIWLVYSSLARGYDMKKLGAMPERSIVYDANGAEMGRLHGENRVSVPLSEVSSHFLNALLSREDHRFYDHGGIDSRGVARALVRDIRDRGFTQGASTITMQLARNSFALRGRSLHRKLLEMALARRIEARHSKDEILELYVNRIFFGTGLYGVERAAQAYFGKAARDLSVDEGAMLAAIIRGPNKFSPFRSPEAARSGRDMVLRRMVVQERLTPHEAEVALAATTTIQAEPVGTSQESYALDAVRRALDSVLDAEDEEDGGLRIHTTIDMRLQAAAEQALEEQLASVEKSRGYPHPTRARWRARSPAPDAAPDYVQGAVVVFDNSRGAALAVVGGRDFGESPFNRALLAKRPIGSTFKPFVYASAVQTGLFPSTLVDDGPVSVGGWAPKNSDGKFGGLLPAEIGLARSRNTMTVRVGERAGLDRIVELADRLALGPVTHPSPQLFIGNHEATLHALTSAYTAFPNAGEKLRPYLIDRVENRAGDVVFRNEPMGYSAMAPGATWCVTRMLEAVFAPGGTAARARSLGYRSAAAGKTGTTDNFKDAWFVGFTKRLTCGVWVGLDQPDRITGQAYGGRMALPVWVAVMRQAENLGYAPGPSPAPDVSVEKAALCRVSGLAATSECQSAGTAVTDDVPIDLLDHFVTGPCLDHGAGRPFAGSGPTRRPRDDDPPSSSGPGLWQRLKSLFR